MEVRIYEIENKTLSKLKNILEDKDKLDIEIKCKKCGKTEVRTIFAEKYKDLVGEDGEKEVKCSCGEEADVNIKRVIKNEFAINGYILKGGKSLGVKENFNYLYIKAEKDFFEKHEKTVLVDGVKKLQGKDLEKIKLEIEKEQESAAEGLGGIFNI
jgi:hypothetical protein